MQTFRIQDFGNPNIAKYCQTHFGHDGVFFTAFYWVDLEIKPSKIALQCDLAKVPDAYRTSL